MSGDSRGIESALRALGRRLDRLETDVVAPLTATVDVLHKRVTEEDDDHAKLDGHRPWKCSACRALLGFYDVNEDVVRIRVKDYHVRFHAGCGGWAEVPCRRCGQPNRVADSTPAAG